MKKNFQGSPYYEESRKNVKEFISSRKMKDHNQHFYSGDIELLEEEFPEIIICEGNKYLKNPELNCCSIFIRQ